jgi:hypothetical protein
MPGNLPFDKAGNDLVKAVLQGIPTYHGDTDETALAAAKAADPGEQTTDPPAR